MRITRRILVFIFLFVCVASFGFSSEVKAAAFDQNNIIDNSIFDNNQTMSANDIQNFLSGFPNSCLKNYLAPYPTDYFTYGSNVSAATVIRRAADLWGINPQVILTTLEKEESLVSGNSGCAGWQYQSAMGMGCPDSGACPSPAYAGFSQQVTKGSWQLMFNRERAEGNMNWDNDGSVNYPGFFTTGTYARYAGGPTTYYDGYATIDGASVYMGNGATASLYTYTPHFHGNQLFNTIFNSWFGTTHGTFLLQSPASPAVYLQSGNTRYGVPSYETLRAYGFGNIKVTPVSDQYMQSLTNGGTLGTTFTVEGSNAVYLADNGYRFGFATVTQCANWGFPNCLNTTSSKTLSPSIFNQLHNGGDMKSLMLNGSTVYLMQDGKKRPFLSGTAMTENGFNNSSITPITNSNNLQQPYGYSIPENNSFVSFKASPVIYIYASGAFYPINSYAVFQSILPSTSKVFTDNYSLYNSVLPPPQKSVSAFISLENGTKSYMLSNGNKYDITGVTANWPTTQEFDEINNILAKKPTAATINANSTFQTPSGYLFRVISKVVIPFYGLNDFFNSPFTKQPLSISSDTVAGLTTGNPYLVPGGGSLYQVNTAGKQNTIYTLNQDGTSCALSSLSQLADFRFDSSHVLRLNSSTPNSHTLKGLVKDSTGAYYIVSRGTKTPISSSWMLAWGMNQDDVCTFSSIFTKNIPTSQTNKNMLFARLPNGSIFSTQNGEAHLVQTYNKFLSMGGNSSNTVDVSSDFSSYVTVGSPIY